MSRTVKVIFTFSVVLNMLFAGWIGGHIYKIWKYSPSQRMAAMKEVSPDARTILKDSFVSRKDELRTSFRKSRDKREALIKVLEADEFDPQAFDRAWAELQAVMEDMAEEKALATKEAAAKLSAEDRRAMAKMLAGGLSGREGRHSMHKPGLKRAEKEMPGGSK